MSATLIRWAARGLSVLILAIWGYFLIASVFGTAARGSRPLVAGDYVLLGAVVTSLVGLSAAWKWEAAGACLTLAAFATCAAMNLRVLASPVLVIPIAACLFLMARWLDRQPRTTTEKN